MTDEITTVTKKSTAPSLPWDAAIAKVFAKESVPGFDTVTPFTFEVLRNSVIEKFTIFIDGQFLYHAMRRDGYKVQINKLLGDQKLSKPIYYYTVWNQSGVSKVQNFIDIISKDSVRGFSTVVDFDKLNTPTKLTNEALRREVSLVLLPHMILDMLRLIYKIEENTKDINSIIVISNNISLIPIIKEMMDNDIGVYLAVSKQIKTSPVLLRECSGIVDMKELLHYFSALQDKAVP